MTSMLNIRKGHSLPHYLKLLRLNSANDFRNTYDVNRLFFFSFKWRSCSRLNILLLFFSVFVCLWENEMRLWFEPTDQHVSKNSFTCDCLIFLVARLEILTNEKNNTTQNSYTPNINNGFIHLQLISVH